jgi:hypothetical protein
LDAGDGDGSLRKISLGAGVVWSVSALLALWIGGWVAGRLTPEPARALGRLHGVVVWAVATVAAAFVLGGGAGALAGGVAKLTGKTVEAAGRAAGGAAQGAGDFVSRVVDQNSDLLGGFARELLPEANARGGDATEGAGRGDALRAERRLSWALVRFFSQDGEARTGEAKDALVRAVAENTELDEAEARRRVDEWIATYDEVKADIARMAEQAEARALEAAEESCPKRERRRERFEPRRGPGWEKTPRRVAHGEFFPEGRRLIHSARGRDGLSASNRKRGAFFLRIWSRE